MSGLPSPSSTGAQGALDFAAGLERMMGDTPMYLRVLARFRSDYADTVARLRAAISVQDAALAHRTAHTLKGAAAMIEARGLRVLAVEVETLLRAGAPVETQLLERLEVELARVMAQVDSLAAAPAAGAQVRELAVDLAEGELTHLCGLLDLGDSGAQDFMAEKHAALRTRLGAARMAELEAAVAAFDYERALGVLGAGQDCQAHQ